MNKTLLLVICIILTFSGKSYNQTNDFLIVNDKAGPFTKDMPTDKALQIAEDNFTVKESAISLEGDEYLVYEIFSGSELLLKLEPACEEGCNLSRIWVYSGRFKTNKRIGVGSTISELLEEYTFDYLQTEGLGRCLFVKELDVCFDLDPNAFSYEWYTSGAKFEEIPKDTKITLILL